MKIIREFIDCVIQTKKYKGYVCESTVNKHKGELEFSIGGTITYYDKTGNPIVIKTHNAVYLKN